MAALVIAGIALKIAQAGRKVFKLRKQMRKLTPEPKRGEGVKAIVKKSLKQTPKQLEKKKNLAGQINKVLESAGKGNRRKVSNKAASFFKPGKKKK